MRGTTARDAKPESPMAGPYAGSIGLCGLLGCFVFGIACALGLSDLSNQDADARHQRALSTRARPPPSPNSAFPADFSTTRR